MVLRQVVINFATSGDHTVIQGSSGSSPVHVYGIMFTVDGATAITFKDSAGTSLSGALLLTGSGSSLTLPISASPWFPVGIGNDFIINSSNAVSVQGTVWYALGRIT